MTPTEELQKAARSGAWFLVISSILYIDRMWIAHWYSTFVSAKSYQETALSDLSYVILQTLLLGLFMLMLLRHVQGYSYIKNIDNSRIFFGSTHLFSKFIVVQIVAMSLSLMGGFLETQLLNTNDYNLYLDIPLWISGALYMASASMFGLSAVTARQFVGTSFALWFAFVGLLWGLFCAFGLMGMSAPTVIISPPILEWLYVVPGIFLFLRVSDNQRA